MGTYNECKLSSRISRGLDCMGYALQTIKAAQATAEIVQDVFTNDERFTTFLAGSGKEGVAFFNSDSDFDFMQIVKGYSFTDISQGGEERYKLLLTECPPGYALVEDAFKGSSLLTSKYDSYTKRRYTSSESNSLFDIKGLVVVNVKGPTILRSRTVLQNEHDPITERRTGPSLEQKSNVFRTKLDRSFDLVLAIPGNCSYYFRIWHDRTRPYCFPPISLLKEISKMDAHVVPVGCKNTDKCDLQWRICFTMAEVALIQSFNATQYKVYVLLKMLSKEVIKTICPDITSYVMKNVILWVSELYPISMFQENNIPQCLVVCIHFLRQCIRNRYVPNYMIPDRDILYGKLNDRKAKRIDQVLHQLEVEGGKMVLRCERLKTTMNAVETNLELEDALVKMPTDILGLFSLCLSGNCSVFTLFAHVLDQQLQGIAYISHIESLPMIVEISTMIEAMFKALYNLYQPIIDEREVFIILQKCTQLKILAMNRWHMMIANRISLKAYSHSDNLQNWVI